MHSGAIVLGFFWIALTLLDAFETILLPRRIGARLRYSRFYYAGVWALWRRVARALPRGKWREAVLSVFGPLSMLGLFTSWALSLIASFALVHWGEQSVLLSATGRATAGYLTYLYISATSFFTLGLGDVSPVNAFARVLTDAEAGMGLGFLAITVGYLPVLYQAFSRREVTISLLDGRAGSPPAGGEFLLRLARAQRAEQADATLREWEQWCAELLESHISFPVLAYYRSQHANQSWLAALTAMLDACALRLALLPAGDTYQAELTFAMARHAAVDMVLIVRLKPRLHTSERWRPGEAEAVHDGLRAAGVGVEELAAGQARLAEIRSMYEPFVAALAEHFVLDLPALLAVAGAADNWQRSAWMPRTPGIGRLPGTTSDGDKEHFG